MHCGVLMLAEGYRRRCSEVMKLAQLSMCPRIYLAEGRIQGGSMKVTRMPVLWQPHHGRLVSIRPHHCQCLCRRHTPMPHSVTNSMSSSLPNLVLWQYRDSVPKESGWGQRRAQKYLHDPSSNRGKEPTPQNSEISSTSNVCVGQVAEFQKCVRFLLVVH